MQMEEMGGGFKSSMRLGGCFCPTPLIAPFWKNLSWPRSSACKQVERSAGRLCASGAFTKKEIRNDSFFVRSLVLGESVGVYLTNVSKRPELPMPPLRLILFLVAAFLPPRPIAKLLQGNKINGTDDGNRTYACRFGKELHA